MNEVYRDTAFLQVYNRCRYQNRENKKKRWPSAILSVFGPCEVDSVSTEYRHRHLQAVSVVSPLSCSSVAGLLSVTLTCLLSVIYRVSLLLHTGKPSSMTGRRQEKRKTC